MKRIHYYFFFLDLIESCAPEFVKLTVTEKCRIDEEKVWKTGSSFGELYNYMTKHYMHCTEFSKKIIKIRIMIKIMKFLLMLSKLL